MQFPSFLLLAAAIPAVLGTATAQRVVRTLLGDQPGAAYGRAIAAAGDVDGDGIRELVVGEPLRALGVWTQGGAVRLVRLGTGVTSVFSLGLDPGAQLGSSVAGIGDFDGDGIADFAAGAPQAGVHQAGRVRVLSGANGTILLEHDGEEYAEFGTAICAGGDINLDGRAEVVISSPWASNVRPIGRAQTLDRHGAQWAQVTGTTGSDDYGRSLASIGDVDGDGKPDYAIGQPGYDFGGSNSGCVRLQSSRAGGAVGLRWEVYFGLQSGDAFGRVVAAAGDVNGDGIGDVLVGDARQRVHVLSGVDGSGLGVVANPEFGAQTTLAGCGDWNGDGRQDFVVGVPLHQFGTGRVFVYTTNPIQWLATLDGSAGSGFGAAVAGVGDVDGDGRADFAVGAPGFQVNGQTLGAVTVHGFDVPATATVFGQGCAGLAGTPNLYFGGGPRLGTTFTLRCANVQPNQAGAWLAGFSNTTLGTTALPLDLQPFGIRGCTLLVAPEATQLLLTSQNYANWSLAVPSTPSFAGVRLFVQACQFDATRPGGLVFSDAANLRLGNL